MTTATVTKKTAAAKIADTQVVEAQNNGLTAEQKAKMLTECEATIEKGQSAFFATAYAVKMIRDKGLYAPEFENITAYCVTKWDFTPSDVSRFTNAADVLETLKKHKVRQLPTMEGHTRALAELSEGSGKNRKFDKCVPVWVAALNSGKKITGSLIRELAKQTETTPTSTDPKEVTQTVDSVAQTTAEPKQKCSAKLHVEVDSSVLKDALEYKGVECSEVLPGIWEFVVEAESKAALFGELASWSAVYAVKKVTVVFA